MIVSEEIEKPGRFSWWPLAVYGVAAVSMALIVTLSAFPPLQDYWEWAYQGSVIHRMLVDGAASGPFEFKSFPVPNSLSQAIIGLLCFVTTPVIAAKLVIIAFLALTFLVYRALRAIAPPARSSLAMLIIFILLAGSQFFNGYINNSFGNLFLTLYFARLIRREPSAAETLFFSVLVFFCHATSYAVFGMIVVIFFLWRKLNWTHLLAMIPSGILFLWYAASKEEHSLDSLVLNGPIDWLTYKIYTATKLGPYHNFFFDGVGERTTMPVWFWIGVAINVAFALFLLLLILRMFVFRRLDWISKPEFIAPGILLAAYPLMPSSVSGVVNIGERFLTIAILLLIVTASTLRVRRSLMVGSILASFILPVTAVFGQLTLERFPNAGHRDPVVGVLEKEDRLDVLFWHRSFQSAYRLDDIRAVQAEGLANSAPLDFTTSLIRPAETSEVQADEP